MLHPTGTPATLTNRTERQSQVVKPTGFPATTTQPVQPQPEQKVETVAATPPAPQPVAQGCDAYIPLIDQYSWNQQVAFAVMKAENTGCNPAKDNAGLNYDGSVDYGLFQVNSIHADMVGGNLDALRDPATNIDTAYKIYSGSGWRAWSTYNNGKYLSYL